MKAIGYSLVVAGFLGGAYLASLDAVNVNWEYFLPVVLLGGVGPVLIRIADKRHARSDDVMADNRANIEDSLANIVTNLDELKAREADIPPYDMRFEIDKHFREDLNRFADARHTLGHMYSLQAYADIMSAFAAGERYLNRVWSASADGYEDDVREYLGRASEQFHDARAKLDEVHAAHAAA